MRVYQGADLGSGGADLEGIYTNARMGLKVAMNSDGTVVAAIGRQNSWTPNDNHAHASSNALVIALGIDGGRQQRAAGDAFASSIAMNADGTVVAIGVNDGVGTRRMHQLAHTSGIRRGRLRPPCLDWRVESRAQARATVWAETTTSRAPSIPSRHRIAITFQTSATRCAQTNQPVVDFNG